MKIVEALITDISEAVTTRDICGGLAIMHGKITVTALALLDDGRCVKLRGVLEENGEYSRMLAQLSDSFSGQEVNPANIVERHQPKNMELEI